MSNAAKVAISLPRELAHDLERFCRELKTSRSALVQLALKNWMQDRKLKKKVRQYESGYLNNPETRQEIDAAQASAVELLSGERWD